MGIGFKGARLLVALLSAALLVGLFMLVQWNRSTGVAGVAQSHGALWGTVVLLLAEKGIDLPLIYGNYHYATDVWQWSRPAALLYAAPGLLLAIPLLLLGLGLLF